MSFQNRDFGWAPGLPPPAPELIDRADGNAASRPSPQQVPEGFAAFPLPDLQT